MLVLTRRAEEKILLPSIDTTIHIVTIKSGTVRIGIDAPAHVPVYREEILDPAARPAPQARGLSADALRQIASRISSGTVGVALLRRQLELGLVGDAGDTLARLESELEGLREGVSGLAPPPAPAVAPAPAPRRALLVEDDANECRLLAGFLRMGGIEVVTAADGEDALAALDRDARPDVVLLDMFMPRCDGPSTLRAIRGNPGTANLRVFGLTGADPSQFGLPDGPSGIDRWFPKPLDPEALLRELAAR